LHGRPLPPEARAYVAIVASAIGRTSSPIVVAAADKLAWTRALLFVAHVER